MFKKTDWDVLIAAIMVEGVMVGFGYYIILLGVQFFSLGNVWASLAGVAIIFFMGLILLLLSALTLFVFANVFDSKNAEEYRDT